MTPLNTDDQPDNMHFVDFFNIIGCKYFQLLLFLSLVCKSLCKKSKSNSKNNAHKIASTS